MNIMQLYEFMHLKYFEYFLYISLTTTHLFKNLLKIHHVRI